MIRTLALLAAAVLATVAAGTASASQLVDRNATGVTLGVDKAGYALLTYTAGGKLKHVLAFDAVNAIPPAPGKSQVKLKLDYSGGYGTFKQDYENSFLVHNPGGNFCYGVFPHRQIAGKPVTGKGTKYRITIIGPGVTPDSYWEGPSPGPYDKARDDVANAEQHELAKNDKLCKKD